MLRLCAAVAVAAFFVTSPETPGAPGILSVASDPADAAVYVDGQFVGRTPVEIKALEPGDHRVRLVKDGYLENGRVVNVASGKTGSLQVRLTSRTAAEAMPPQAQGSGVSSGGGGGISKKWLLIGAAGGGAAAAYFLTRSSIDSISASPTTGLQSATQIRFSAAGAGSSASLSWDFGDGSTSSDRTPTHVYNTTGTFSVKCTVGGSSVTTSVTIKSLTGTWQGNLIDPVQGPIVETLIFTQSGTAISGTMSDVYGPGTLSGSTSTSAPLVRVTITQQGFNPFNYTADPNGDVTALNGVVNGSGFNNAQLNLTRR
jgi:PEGA domain-containing protein/PKD domain-containing protein